MNNSTLLRATLFFTQRSRGTKVNRVLLFLCFLFFVGQSFAQTNTWDGSGGANWTTASSWSLNVVPTAAHDVVIPNGITSTININTAAVCKSLTINSGGTANTLSITNSAYSLTVTNGITIGAGTGSGDHKTLAVNTGTLSAGAVTMTATGSSNREARITVSTGTVNIDGNISMGANNFFRFTSNGVLNIEGNISGGTLVPSTGTVNFRGSSAQVITGANTSNFYNLTINKNTSLQTVTNTGNAITVGGSLTVNTGTLHLSATDANSTVSGDFVVGTGGRVSHNVNWDTYGRLFSVGGDIAIDGVFSYSVRSHVQMTGSGTKYVRTGSSVGSAFSILTLTTGNYLASGDVNINDNFWPMFSTAGSFHTNGNSVNANAALLTAGGTVYVDGGSLNVTGGLYTGTGMAGALNISSGTLTTDVFNLGDGTVAGTVAQSGGTFNITGNVNINTGSVFTCSNSPAINVGGNWNSNNNGGFVPATSTVTFNNGSADQFITGSATAQSFSSIDINKPGRSLHISGSIVTLNARNIAVNQGTLNAGTATAVNMSGNWMNNGSFTAGSARVTFNGTALQTISGSSITTFNMLTVNNTSGIALSGVDAGISGGTSALTFSSGRFSTGVNKLMLASGTTISGASTGKYVNGTLDWGVATGNSSKMFAVGDAVEYTPVNLSFNSVTTGGRAVVSVVGTEHPQIVSSQLSEDRSVNRTYTISAPGLLFSQCSANFYYRPSDVDAGANTGQFIVGRYNAGWTYPTVASRTATNISVSGLTSFGSFAIAEGGAEAPEVSSDPVDASACIGYGTSFSASFTSQVNTNISWYVSTNGGGSYSPVSIAAPYSVSASQAGNIFTSTLNIDPFAGSMVNYRYYAMATNNRGSGSSNSAVITATAMPTANAGPAVSSFCGGGTSAPLGGSVGGSASTGVWSSDAGGSFSPSATDLNATWTPPAAYYGTATLTLTTTNSCAPVSASKTITVDQAPDIITFAASTVNLCQNEIRPLTVTNNTFTTFSSGTVSQSIPNNSAIGTTHTISVSGIPAGAIINSVSVTFNVTHTRVGDLIMNIKAPNGSIFNLANKPTGGAGTNFTETTVSSDGTVTFASSSSPFTGTYAPDAVSGIGANGFVSNTTNFANLFTVPNGNWTIIARDAAASNTGSLTSWTIQIGWMQPVTWSPFTNLYTNVSATTPYTGQVQSTVYVKGNNVSSTVYTATATSPNGCVRTGTATANINQVPEINIGADYCYGPYTIQLWGQSNTPVNYLWNTGETTDSIVVDIAGDYIITGTTAAGCSASDTVKLGLEGIDNGDFEQGNTGFSSAYSYVSNTVPNGMTPEQRYTVHNDGNFTHTNFWGKDHTTGSGNFMIINGSGTTPPPNVWQKTINVIPNTLYYFSAWAISLNSVGPYANLQFKVNGTQVGTTTGALPARPQNNNPPFEWVRFFGTWNSGSATTAVVSIVDLTTAAGGNDFGLDDISFGTLAPFIKLNTIGKDTQVVCKNVPIDAIIYTIGGGDAGPQITGLPPGVTSSFEGTTLTLSGTPVTAGVYNYTIQTTGDCNTAITHGKITINEQSLTLTSAPSTANQIICIYNAITPIRYTIGGVATGASVSGLPSGVTSSFSGGVLTISGTPGVIGTFNYTVTSSGTCQAVTETGTIVSQRQLISLSSGAGSNIQSVCRNATMNNITYTVGGSATNATITGLPPGVSGVYDTGVFTISGAPTQNGTYHFVVTTSGNCSPVSVAGDIYVIDQSISRTSAVNSDNQSICLNTPISPITYSVGGTANGATVTGLPAGMSGYYSAGMYTISGSPQQDGVFNYTVTTSGNCTPAIATGTVTVYPPSLGGTVANVSICSGESGTITLTGYTGNIVRWQTSSDGVSWSNISNTTSTQNYTNITSATYYRAQTQTGACAVVNSSTGRVGIHNLWTGAVDSDWNNGANWSDGLVPTSNCDNVVIPIIGSNVYPQLTAGVATIENLIVNSGATMTVENATLQVSGTITNNGSLNFELGTLELNGTTPQTIAGSQFENGNLYGLIVSNSSGVALTGTNDTLKIISEIAFGTSGAVLNTNGNLTLVSNINGTASVADMTGGGLFSGNDIVGNVTVERYIPQHSKAWQLLSVPTKGSTIKASWQEGNSPLGNIRPGYGTIITGSVAGAVAQGFDIYTPAGASLKTYNSNTNAWDGVASTNLPIANKKGYMFLVRGDRSVTTSNAPATETTLRTTGQLYTSGANAPDVTNVSAGKMESVGNPYASAIDFSLVGKTGGIANMFYVWDPRLTNSNSPYGLGGYQTFTWAGGSYQVTPGGGSYTNGNTNIESGQAFMVYAPATSGSITFNESAKVSGHNVVNRAPLGYWEMLRTNMYAISGGTRVLVDGVMTQFSPDFSNGVDYNDAPKMTNTGENLALFRENKRLSVESRYTISPNDTLYFMLSQMRIMQYQFDFVPRDLGGNASLEAYLEDNYLGTSTPVSLTDTTRISFSVTNIAGSYAANRFRLVFKTLAMLPVTFTQVSANRNRDKHIEVKWKVENETSMEEYVVERSANGRDFNAIAATTPMANNGGAYQYLHLDRNPLSMDNYYRIKGISLNGMVQYSPVVLVKAEGSQAVFSVYPNPVKNKTLQLHVSGEAAGEYRILLVNALGQVLHDSKLTVPAGSAVIPVHLKNISKGIYYLKLTGAVKFSRQVIIE